MGKEEVRVVIVEDEADIREAFTSLLEIDGYTVRSAADGEGGLQLVRDFQPACVLLDVGLPGMNGIELTQRLRGEIGTDLVVIAITGGVSPAERDRLEQAGIDFILTKPVFENDMRRFLPPLNGPA
jgi:CheY-like chemotaxis protein